MAGYVCRRHFDQKMPRVHCTHLDEDRNSKGWMCRDCSDKLSALNRERDAEQDACPDCQAVREEQRARTQREDTIDPKQPWGDHISLMCRNHPNKRWHTKNISYIGARTIFFSGEWVTKIPFAPVWKPGHPIASTDPVQFVKARLAGVNPYNSSVKEEPIKEWDELVSLVNSLNNIQEECSFQCSCSTRDLEVAPITADVS